MARSLALKRSSDAQAAVLRAVRQRDGDERVQLIERESARLNELETRIRSRDAEQPEKMERRLVALGKLREKLKASES